MTLSELMAISKLTDGQSKLSKKNVWLLPDPFRPLSHPPGHTYCPPGQGEHLHCPNTHKYTLTMIRATLSEF